MVKFFILDDNMNVIQCDNRDYWREWVAQRGATIAKTLVGDKYYVETTFAGYSLTEGHVRLFETALRLQEDGKQLRRSVLTNTFCDAISEHANMVRGAEEYTSSQKGGKA